MCYIAIHAMRNITYFQLNKIDTGYYNPESVNRLILYIRSSHSGGKELIPQLQALINNLKSV